MRATMPASQVNFPVKAAPLQSVLIGVYLHILEHERVVAESQVLAAGSGHIPENDFPGSDEWKLLLVGIVGHLWIECCKNGEALVVRRMIGVIDMKIFDGNPFRHITGVAEIMLTGIGTADQAGIGRSASGRHENTVADEEFSLPCTAVISAQVDEAPSADGGVLHG